MRFDQVHKVISGYLPVALIWLVLSVVVFAPGIWAAEPQVQEINEEVGQEAKKRELDADNDPLTAKTAEFQEANEEVDEEAKERELNAGEDPLVSKTTELKETPQYKYRDHTSIQAYGSVRFRYSDSQENNWDDGGSRVGLNGELQFRPRFWLFGRAEVGFNVFDTVSQLRGGSDRLGDEDAKAAARLAYAGVQTPSTTLVFGKNWSSYYQVSGITDRFEAFGGEASGTYNALTDGGASGTGRADRVLQGRFSIDTPPGGLNLKPFKLNVQVQDNEDIPHVDGATYSHSFGFSALLESNSEKVIGIAYNQAFVEEEDASALKAQGIDGDAKALVLGTRRFGDQYYLGTTLARLENHETTNEGVYFDGWGWEVFGSYNISNRWWVVGGWNALEADNDQAQAGAYRIRYGVAGLRYTFDRFRQMIYTELRFDDSRRADASQPGNTYTLGVRWDIP